MRRPPVASMVPKGTSSRGSQVLPSAKSITSDFLAKSATIDPVATRSFAVLESEDPVVTRSFAVLESEDPVVTRSFAVFKSEKQDS